MGLKIGLATLLLGVTLGARVLSGHAGFAQGDQKKTTRDRVYTKEQAARGAELYAGSCERCHDPEKVPEGKKPGPPTIGAKFLETWQDRTLGELFGTILNTMPSDGSMALTPNQTLDLVAHLLQANGFADGRAALKNDDVMKAIVIVIPGTPEP